MTETKGKTQVRRPDENIAKGALRNRFLAPFGTNGVSVIDAAGAVVCVAGSTRLSLDLRVKIAQQIAGALNS